MKQRFGGLLSLALGAVLITGGSLDAGSSGGVGIQLPSCQSNDVGIAVACPTGTIDISEQAGTPAPAGVRAAAAHAAPANWTVTISSTNCTAPDGSTLDDVVTVPTGGSATSIDLFVYANSSHDAACSYTLSVATVAGYTSTFAPASPVTIPFSGARTGNVQSVTLTNTSTAPVTTTSPAPSTSASSSAASAPATSSAPATLPVSSTPVATGPVDASGSSAAAGAASSSAAPIASTGPRWPVGWTIGLGIALCLLGVALLVTGRTERRRAHR